MAAHHGNTPAAWTAVVVALLGLAVSSVGLMLSPLNWVTFWIGMAVVVVSGFVFVIMAKMGYNVETE